jgi:hypothetical protein
VAPWQTAFFTVNLISLLPRLKIRKNNTGRYALLVNIQSATNGVYYPNNPAILLRDMVFLLIKFFGKFLISGLP